MLNLLYVKILSNLFQDVKSFICKDFKQSYRKLLILKINILLIHSTESLSYLTMEKALKYGILRAMSIWTSWQE